MIKRQLIALLGVPLAVAGVAASTAIPTSATDHEPPPIQVELITPRATFIDDVAVQMRVKLDGRKTTTLNLSDPDRVVTARLTVQPGAQFPWHTHPGPVLITVAEGSLTYMNADDCVARPYPTGTVFIDPGRGNVHTAYNETDQVTVLIATFFEAAAAGPLTVPVDGPADGCGIALADHGH